MITEISLALLGPPIIRCGTQDVTPILRRKTRALLAYLALAEHPLSRLTLSHLFCQESDDPARSLRWHLSAIRRHVAPYVLLTPGEAVELNREKMWLDVTEFAAALTAPLSPQTETALTLYRGEFLAGLDLPDAPEFELWLLGERARLHRLYEQGLTRWITYLIQQAAYEAAIPYALRQVQNNPLLETAHGQLIWLYAQTGQRAAALKQYEQCRDLLWRELAVLPGPELQTLWAEVKAEKTLHSPGSRPQANTPPAQITASTGFVGRESELAQLHQAWQAAQHGQGAVVVIEGAAGIGKSALVQLFIAQMQHGGVYSGCCYASTQTIPYQPWIELLGNLIAEWDDTALELVPHFWWEQIARLLPALALRLGQTGAPAGPGEAEFLFQAVMKLLSARSAHHPLLLFLEDIHWADEASLQLFHFLARHVLQMPVLLLATCRAEELADAAFLQTIWHDLGRGPLLHLRLTPLSATLIAELTDQLWSALAQALRPQAAQLLAAATGGNPLFLTEILRELAHTTAVPADLPVPASLRELIRRRLDHLPESGRQVLEAVAVLDAPFTVTEAQQISGRSEEEAVTAIDLGLRWRLLVSHPSAGPTRYDFSHALMREAVNQQVSAVRCQLLHRRAAHTFTALALRREVEYRQEWAGRIMRHAYEGQAFELVWQWGSIAAAYAQRLYAYPAALAACQRTLTALEQLRAEGHIDRKTAEQQRLTLLLQQIELLALSGRWTEEKPILDEAAALLERHPKPEQVAVFYLCRGTYYYDLDEHELAFADMQRAYERYLILEDEAGMARALYICGRVKIGVGQNREAQNFLNQALTLYRAVGDASGEVLCLSSLAVTKAELGQLDASLYQLLGQAMAIAEQQQDLAGQARIAFVTGAAWNILFHAPQMRFWADKVQELGKTLQNEAWRDRGRYLLANSLIIEGDITQGQALWEQVVQSAQVRGDRWLEGWGAQVLGRVHLQQGQLSTAEQWLKRAAALRQALGEIQNQINDLAWLARLHLAQNQPTLALEISAGAVQELERVREQVYVLDSCDIFMVHAEALQASGRSVEALAVLAQAYRELMTFAAQIEDAAARHSYLSFLHMARIIKAWEQQTIRPYPD